MTLKSFAVTMGLGIVAGAATMLMIPKNSEVYRAADGAAKAIKQEAEKMICHNRTN